MIEMETRRTLEWTVVVAIILVLWSILSIPIVFYALDDTKYIENNTNISAINNSSCYQPSIYAEGLCFEAYSSILRSSECQKQILVPELNEMVVSQSLDILNQLNASPQCFQSMLSFLCLYLVELCDGRELIQASAQQCDDIQYRACTTEWDYISVYLPSCENFPDHRNFSCQAGANVTCQSNFYYDNYHEACVPSCQTWSEVGEMATIGFRVIIIAFDSLGIILSIVVILVSILKHKLMLSFPTIFLVFSTIDVMIIQLISLIGYSNTNLFCSSPTLYNNTATSFCILSGVVFQYCFVQQSLWWIFHLIIIFWGVWFPFHYDKFKSNGRFKKVIFVLTIVGILAPILPIIITVSDTAMSVRGQANETITSRGLGYIAFTHPTIFCAPGRVSFFTYIIPFTMVLAGGGPLIILVIFHFCKRKSAGASDLKLMLVLGYYLLLTFVSIAECMAIVRNSVPLYNSMVSYFRCESRGLQPDTSCPRDFQQYSLYYTTTVLLVVLSLYPSYVLLFAVNISKVKNTFQNCFHTSSSKANSSKSGSVMLSEIH